MTLQVGGNATSGEPSRLLLDLLLRKGTGESLPESGLAGDRPRGVPASIGSSSLELVSDSAKEDDGETSKRGVRRPEINPIFD